MKRRKTLLALILSIWFVLFQAPAPANADNWSVGQKITDDNGDKYEIVSLDTPSAYCPWKDQGYAETLCKYWKGTVISRLDDYSPSDWQYESALHLKPYKIDLASLKSQADWENMWNEVGIYSPPGRGVYPMNIELYDSEYDAPNYSGDANSYRLDYQLYSGRDAHWDNVDVGIAENNSEFYIEHYIHKYSDGVKTILTPSESELPRRSDPCRPNKDGARMCYVYSSSGWNTYLTLHPGESVAVSHALWEKDNGKPTGYDADYDGQGGILSNFTDAMLESDLDYFSDSQAIALKTAAWGLKEMFTGNGPDDRLSTVTSKFTWGALKRIYDESPKGSKQMMHLSSRVDAVPVEQGGQYGITASYDAIWAYPTAGKDLFNYYMYLQSLIDVEKVS